MKRTEGARSKRIKSFLDHKHFRASTAIDRLTAGDLKALAQIARGREKDAVWGERVKAVAAIAGRAGASDRRLLGALVADEREDARVRVAAASALGALTGPDAEDALLACLGGDDPLLQTAALRSLGRMGTARVFKRLQGLPRHPAQFVNRQRDFAEMLVAYRNGIDADPLPFKKPRARPPSPQDELLKTRVRMLSGKQVAAVLRDHRDSRYGLALSPSVAFQIETGEGRLVIALDREAAKAPLLGAVFQRRLILGLALRFRRETATYSTRLVIFSRPVAPSDAELLGVRNDGLPALAGRFRADPAGLSFVLSDIEHPGTARMRIAGSLGAQGVETEASVVYARRIGKRRAADVIVPPL